MKDPFEEVHTCTLDRLFLFKEVVRHLFNPRIIIYEGSSIDDMRKILQNPFAFYFWTDTSEFHKSLTSTTTNVNDSHICRVVFHKQIKREYFGYHLAIQDTGTYHTNVEVLHLLRHGLHQFKVVGILLAVCDCDWCILRILWGLEAMLLKIHCQNVETGYHHVPNMHESALYSFVVQEARHWCMGV